MVSMTDVSQILDVARTVIIGLGALFAVFQLREIARDRKFQLVVNLCSQYLSELTEPYCKLFSEEYADPAEMEKKVTYERLFKLAAFYEAVGLMVRERHVDAHVVMEYLPIVDVWEKMKPWALWYREKTKVPEYWEHFEHLANITNDYLKSRKGYTAP